MAGINVIKIGGSTFGSQDTTVEDIVALQNRGIPLVIVHGGGSMVTEWLTRQGIVTRFVRGERVTDAPALEVVTAVLAGLANKEIVAAINHLGGRAVGISGIDGGLIHGQIKDKDMGYVGNVAKVNTGVLEALMAAGFIPVISPVSLYAIDKPDNAPPIININGDPVTGEIAVALGAERIIFLTDVAGVADGSGEIVSRLSADKAAELIAQGVVSGGMIPKINACLRVLTAGTVTRIIDGREPHALVREIDNKCAGTTIYQ